MPRRRARAPLLQEWSGCCDALAGGQRGDQFPFYLYPTSPGLAWRGPAHIRTQHTPWGTPPPVVETWSPPRLTERFRVFWKCHTLGVKSRVQPPLERPDCHPGRKQSPWQCFPEELNFLRNSQPWSSAFSGLNIRGSRNPGNGRNPGVFQTWVWTVWG